MKKFEIVKSAQKKYPKLLKEIPDPPESIYFRGSLPDEAKPKIAIVGTRKATRYGLESAKNLARDLSYSGVQIISGLAIGIDTAAHRGAIEGETPTFAVLGSGVDNVQPTQNTRLAEKIIVEHGGGIISEYEPTYPASKKTFPERNRIVAGLCEATIVIEAPEKSGALITARLASEYNRDVGALPGETISINSLGTNALIKNGACLIRSSEDVLEMLGIFKDKKLKLDNLDNISKDVLQLLDKPTTAQTIAESIDSSPIEVMQKLSELELSGIIINKEGVFYKNF